MFQECLDEAPRIPVGFRCCFSCSLRLLLCSSLRSEKTHSIHATQCIHAGILQTTKDLILMRSRISWLQSRTWAPLCDAAEIHRFTYSGWNASHQIRFRSFLSNVYLPLEFLLGPTATGTWRDEHAQHHRHLSGRSCVDRQDFRALPERIEQWKSPRSTSIVLARPGSGSTDNC